MRHFRHTGIIPIRCEAAVCWSQAPGAFAKLKLSRPQNLIAVVLVVYVGVWMLRRHLGLVQPMANLRYFHYGTEAGSLTDEGLYVAF